MAKKKTERQKLDEQCLKLWSQCVRMRDKTCRNCNSDEGLQAHHIVQRTYKLSRYNTENGLTLCRRCHFPEHVDPEKFRGMVIGVIGEEVYDELQLRYRQQWKWTVEDLKVIEEELKEELRSLQNA